MLDFTAFEASFNGSQQKFPIFAHFSVSTGSERQKWKMHPQEAEPGEQVESCSVLGPMLTKP